MGAICLAFSSQQDRVKGEDYCTDNLKKDQKQTDKLKTKQRKHKHRDSKGTSKGRQSDGYNSNVAMLNGMLRHSLDREVLFSLQPFIARALDLKPYLEARVTSACNKDIYALFKLF